MFFKKKKKKQQPEELDSKEIVLKKQTCKLDTVSEKTIAQAIKTLLNDSHK